jgi:hypothetical protein
MRSTPFRWRATGLALMVVLLTGALAPLGARAGTVASPVPAERDAGSLAVMLGRLPDRPLGLDGAMVTYADVARQTAALGADAPRGAGDEEGQQRWIEAIAPLSLPQATGQHWSLPEWRAAFGFDLFQVAQAVEYAAPRSGSRCCGERSTRENYGRPGRVGRTYRSTSARGRRTRCGRTSPLA